MGYTTGSAVSSNDLLDKIRIFLLDNGWSELLFEEDGTGYRLHMNKSPSSGSDMYVNFRSCWDEKIVSNYKDYGIGINLSTGFNSDDPWDKQPGCSKGLEEDGDDISTVSQIMIGDMEPVNEYWFFTSGDDILLMCEPTADVYVGLAFGRLKETTYNPRDFWYFTGQSESHDSPDNYYDMNPLFSANSDDYYINKNRCNSYIMDIENERTYYNTGSDFINDTMRIIAPLPASAGTTSGGANGGFLQYLVGRAIPSEAYKTNALLPMYYAVQFLGDSYHSIVGYVGNIRGLRGGRYAANEVISLGEDEWHVFPTDSFRYNANQIPVIKSSPSKDMCIAILKEE